MSGDKDDEFYKAKYLSYKQKYLDLKLKKMKGGNDTKGELILFKADWCGYCTRFKPVWDKLTENYTKVKYTVYDADKDQKTMLKYGITSFPTIMFNNGKEVEKFQGERDEHSLVSYMNARTK